jgi:hypothetical protein
MNLKNEQKTSYTDVPFPRGRAQRRGLNYIYNKKPSDVTGQINDVIG